MPGVRPNGVAPGFGVRLGLGVPSVAFWLRREGVYARCLSVMAFCAFSASLLAIFSRSVGSAMRKGEGLGSAAGRGMGVDDRDPHVILGAPSSPTLGVETKL